MMKAFKSCWIIFFIFLFSGSLNAQSNSAYYQWSKHPTQLAELESLIQNAAQIALSPNDYLIRIEKLAQAKNIKDSNSIDSLIHQTAIHFFSDINFGNQSPNINYLGVNIKKNKEAVNQEILLYLSNKSLQKLLNDKIHQSKEVVLLLKELSSLNTQSSDFQKKKSILMQAINDYRWLNVLRQQQSVILVNIPSTLLHVYEGNTNPINMKVIVGKKSTPTSTLSSSIHQVIVNPYWNVPKSIAIKEMLPILQKDASYIETAHLQVLNEQYKIVQPHQITWSNHSMDHFPFYLRQSTGCDNSLGVIKLDFDSPFGIYLHDTPEKSLFKNASRFYSHGCMRMEKPIDVAKWVMRYDSKSLDTIDFTTCYKNPSPIRFAVKQPVAIVVWYQLIDFDANFKLNYYKDIYNKFH